MKARGKVWVNAPPSAVWAAMTDPAILRVCVPGCKNVRRVGSADFWFDLAGSWGPINAQFGVQVRIHDVEHAKAAAPQRYKVTARGEGSLGLAKGCSDVRLRGRAGGTELLYTADGTIDEHLGRLGAPMLRLASRKLSDTFFARFANAVNAGTVAAE